LKKENLAAFAVLKQLEAMPGVIPQERDQVRQNAPFLYEERRGMT
jgi:hypothetical protein